MKRMNLEHKKYDAILVAGEGESSYKVVNQHKAFLRIEGQCIINYVVSALQKAESVENIYIVGLRDKLTATLEEAGIDLNFPKPIVVVQQKENLYENIWHTFLKSLALDEGSPELERTEIQDRAVLIVPCDAPLITAHEIEYFLAQCDPENYDQMLGLVSSKNLEHFYPQNGAPGVKMAYLHLNEGSYRLNNLHLVKPLRMLNRQYIKDVYQYRYQRNIKNVLPFAFKLIGKDRLERFRYYIGLEMCLLASALGFPRWVDFFRQWVPWSGMEQCLSNILKTRFMGLETPFPGAALDIDNNQDYDTISLRFREWKDYLQSLEKKFPLPPGRRLEAGVAPSGRA